MSGTSLDGVDAVIARLDGSGRTLQIEQEAFIHVPYPEALRDLLLGNSVPDSSSVRDLSQLNVRLAHIYAEAVRRAARAAAVDLEDIDLVGSHGQTVHHVPQAADCAGQAVTSTLQLGSPSVLATLLGLPVVGDFRLADMAHGGQGAPLVPYFDAVFFTDDEETRGLLNLGGIANLTVLPAGGALDDAFAFDTGPANMVLDALAERLLDAPYDADGATAARGTLDNGFVADLLQDPYFAQPPPKSTGREHFGAAFVDTLLAQAERHGISDPADLLANATLLTAASVYQAYAQFVRDRHPLDVLIASGGGTRNAFLMQTLADSFAPIPVRTVADYGLDPDAKEALCFAVLAHETVNGVPTNLPAVTGAAAPALLGSLSVPA
ncbi:MAG: anhydro-N-acetylmuramic acid kinase [Bacteroidetes bacterium]|jgi:anhydro-N-acetylmuramic acid kinase|nr:anhydro-N-acetylmuramic acid kinase [Bacteroidota bacterium]